jgi:hypothetical protein
MIEARPSGDTAVAVCSIREQARSNLSDARIIRDLLVAINVSTKYHDSVGAVELAPEPTATNLDDELMQTKTYLSEAVRFCRSLDETIGGSE